MPIKTRKLHFVMIAGMVIESQSPFTRFVLAALASVLQICSNETVGRTKVYIEVMFSFAAMVMCFSPTLVKLPSTSGYFLFWGIIVVISSLLLWLGNARKTA